MRRLIITCIVILFLSLNLNAQDGTKWRGPNSNGVYNETGLLKEWPEGGPAIAWHYDNLGKGYSSPVIAGNKIYVSGMIGSDGYIFCLTLHGELLWKKMYGKEWTENYPGSRTSPNIVNGMLYIFSGQMVVVCMDADNGEIKWKSDLVKDYGARNLSWGATENLVIHEDKVICTPGGSKHNVIALDRLTGMLKWTCTGKGEKSAYNSPLLVKLTNRNIFITMTENNILGIDADNGKFLWSYGHTNAYSVHANTPIYHDGSIYCFSGYGRGGVKLRLLDDGSKIRNEWINRTMDSRMGGAVLVDGLIFGSGDYNRQWQCIDWETGKQKYTSTAVGKGVSVYADGLIYCYSDRGEIAILKPGSNAFTLQGKGKVTYGSEQHWAHPVIHDDRLYVRHGKSLIAYVIK